MVETRNKVFIVACMVPEAGAPVKFGERQLVEKLYSEEELNGLLEDGWTIDQVKPMTTGGEQPPPGVWFASLLVLKKGPAEDNVIQFGRRCCITAEVNE